MGCWEETCGITNTVIWKRDPVVMVVLGEESKDRLSVGGDFLDLWRVTDVVKGRYNHYGWIEGYREPDRATHEWLRNAFFHKKAWDAILEKSPPDDHAKIMCDLGNNAPKFICKQNRMPADPGLLAEFCAVHSFCELHRRNILGSRDTRRQEYGKKRDGYQLLLDLSQQMLDRRRGIKWPKK